jgi:hypothetical protein
MVFVAVVLSAAAKFSDHVEELLLRLIRQGQEVGAAAQPPWFA